MWAIRILNGPQAGQIFRLKKGKNKIGRSATTDFQLQSNAVSKEHLEIEVFSDKVVVTDLQSANGTYLNGVKVRRSDAKLGDKLSASDVLFDIIFAQDRPALQPTSSNNVQPFPNMPQSHSAGGAPAYPPQGGYQPQSGPPHGGYPPQQHPPPRYSSGFFDDFKHKFDDYMEKVALPAIYRLPEVFEFRSVIFGFAGVFVIIVTLLAMLPMKYITSESIMAESKRRALTVARTLANANSKIIKEGRFSEYNAELLFREEGIDDVYVISKDGTILAPPDRTGATPNKEIEFIYKLRAQNKEIAAELPSGKVAAGAPIVTYDNTISDYVARAYAVVIFNTESLAYDDGRALSLFIQMLFLAGLCGLFIFYLLYKVVERPFALLKTELDLSLKEGRDQAEIDIKLPIMHEILVSINSLMSRAIHGDAAKPMGSSQNKEIELSNVLNMVGYPALLINRDSVILAANPAFERLTGVGTNRIIGQSVQFIPDQALQKNLQVLINTAKASPNQVAKDQLEINSNQAVLQCQAVSGLTSEPEYFMVTFSPADEIQGGAA